MSEIKYLTNSEIDKQKWDFCIKNSFNTSIEVFSWYLDAVCDSWDGLVQNDYMRVMPLPVSTKFGLKIVDRPQFLNNTGVFSIGKLNETITSEFINAIPSNIKFFRIALNRFNKFYAKNCKISKHFSFSVDLIQSYPELHNKYAVSFQEKIASAETHKLIIQRKLPISEYIQFLSTIDKQYSSESEQIKFKTFLEVLLNHRVLEIRGIYNGSDEPLCMLALMSHMNSVSVISLDCSPKGISYNADVLLIDECVREFAGRNLVMDFVSLHSARNIELLSELSAYLTEYLIIEKNKLPWLVNKIIH